MNAPTNFDKAALGAQALREKLVVIGNGMAGCRAVEEILARDPERYAITIFGAEPRVNYNRIMLSPVLAGEKSFDEIVLNTADWYAENGIELIAGDPVDHIDRERSVVIGRSGRVEPYDRLLIATGSDPFIIPVPGRDLPGVVTFRDLDDVEKMLAAAGEGGNAVVIGGGLLGLEAAHGLALRGMSVTVVHLMPTLMERQLDEAAGWLLKTELERRGQTILTGADTQEIIGKDGHVAGVRLKDGREIPADIVVMAVGIRPSTMLAKTAGLECERGVLVDDHMVTSDPNVLAVGECVQHRGQCYGLVAPLWEMCRALADHLTEQPTGYTGSVTSTKLKVSGIDVFSAGDFTGGDEHEDIVMRDAARGVYKRVVLKDDRIVGAVLYGDTADGNWYFDLLKKQEDISEIRDGLIFGQAFAMGGGAFADPNAAVAALSDDAEICGCNGVSKGKVVATIEAGACSLDAVRSQCKASASCGSCTGLVESLLALTLGDEVQVGAKSLCKCTSFTHDDARAADRRERAQGDPAGDAGAALDHARRLRIVPPGAQLLPAVRLAGRVRGRPEEPLRQRAASRQHPEGRDLFGRPAHVGRADQPDRAARDRRRGREVQRADGQGDRRPAARHLRDQEGGSARGLGRSQRGRDGFGPRLRQGAAHGEDVRRQRVVPVRHAGSRPVSGSRSSG